MYIRTVLGSLPKTYAKIIVGSLSEIRVRPVLHNHRNTLGLCWDHCYKHTS